MSERVGIAELRIAGAPTILKAFGLGSCLAITLYDPSLRLGALVHSLLPQARGGVPSDHPAKYVDAAIALMVNKLVQAGADATRLQGKLAGGANMFEADYVTLIGSVGARNVRSAREALAAHHIPLMAEDVGGNRGRTVEFHLASGRMLVYCARENRMKTI
jgi:chemotaxis protein CheD